MLIQRAGTGTLPPPGFPVPLFHKLVKQWESVPAPTEPTVSLGPAEMTLGWDDQESDDLLPELKVLRLAGAPSFDSTLFVDMVKSRTDPPLECLELVLTDEAADLEAETEARLKEILGEKGFSCRRSFPIKIEPWKPKTD